MRTRDYNIPHAKRNSQISSTRYYFRCLCGITSYGGAIGAVFIKRFEPSRTIGRDPHAFHDLLNSASEEELKIGMHDITPSPATNQNSGFLEVYQRGGDTHGRVVVINKGQRNVHEFPTTENFAMPVVETIPGRPDQIKISAIIISRPLK